MKRRPVAMAAAGNKKPSLTSPTTPTRCDEPNKAASQQTSPRGDPKELLDGESSDKAFDPLDPATRRAAQLAPHPNMSSQEQQLPLPLAERGASDREIAPRARVSMEELLPQLVRRIAWAGDRSRGTVQLELGAGRHEGTTVTVHADGGRVRIELSGKDPRDVEHLRGRIDARLRRHGLDVESVT